MQSLDQIVALCGGIITLIFSFWEAYMEKKDSRETPEEIREDNSVELSYMARALRTAQLAKRRRSV
jgi:hypothetical protein